jgi:hypothetical protein
MRIFVMLCLSLMLASSRSASAQNTCHRADVTSAHFIETLNMMMDTSQTAFRAKLQMPLVTSSAIVLVSDSATCARAGLAGDSIVKVFVPNAVYAPTTAPLYVIKIGTSFAVADLNQTDQSDFDWVFIFGPLWEYRGSMRM